jgi:hypothetical protein
MTGQHSSIAPGLPVGTEVQFQPLDGIALESYSAHDWQQLKEVLLKFYDNDRLAK